MRSTESVNKLKVAELTDTWGEELQIELIAGQDGLKRRIGIETVQELWPALPNPNIEQRQNAIYILSEESVSNFNKFPDSNKQTVLKALFSKDIPCIIAQNGHLPGDELIKACEETNVPLFTSKLPLKELIPLLNKILQDKNAPFTTAHGVLLDINELGVLILGKSGIGKSENALDLINRGSKLISDDVVEIKKSAASELTGSGPERIKHLMEIRGIGIINIMDLFGKGSVMESRGINMVIELVEWDSDTEYDRLGIDEKVYKIMGVELPYLLIPVKPGRNTATIIEVAVRNQRLKSSGSYSTRKILE